jgi:predicted RNA-binding Zn-ribbon protein involved in translation (DUF1610 family)
MTPKRAQLLAEAVSVLCPACGEPQPNHEGSEMWIRQDFERAKAVRPCVACDVPLLVSANPTARFA